MYFVHHDNLERLFGESRNSPVIDDQFAKGDSMKKFRTQSSEMKALRRIKARNRCTTDKRWLYGWRPKNLDAFPVDRAKAFHVSSVVRIELLLHYRLAAYVSVKL